MFDEEQDAGYDTEKPSNNKTSNITHQSGFDCALAHF